ncbi:FxsA family protein [Fodinicola acaciae]|uniref:FxsA family protein n=1 Tax=Fodinicola acaciae TaxID=2681555 RepID=UPI0013CFB1EE|nr:FxsA family protein [Fodinicola acaciae]
MRWFVITVAALVGTAILEVALIAASVHYLGVLVTLLLMVATSALGFWLLTRQSSRAWREMRSATADQRPPTAEAVDGVYALVASLLVVVPGFLTDAIGLIALIPVVRRAVHRRVLARLALRLPPSMVGPVRVQAKRGRSSATHTPTTPTTSVDARQLDMGTIVEGDVR